MGSYRSAAGGAVLAGSLLGGAPSAAEQLDMKKDGVTRGEVQALALPPEADASASPGKVRQQ